MISLPVPPQYRAVLCTPASGLSCRGAPLLKRLAAVWTELFQYTQGDVTYCMNTREDHACLTAEFFTDGPSLTQAALLFVCQAAAAGNCGHVHAPILPASPEVPYTPTSEASRRSARLAPVSLLGRWRYLCVYFTSAACT